MLEYLFVLLGILDEVLFILSFHLFIVLRLIHYYTVSKQSVCFEISSFTFNSLLNRI